jgi:uncharacterized Zn-finger protein
MDEVVSEIEINQFKCPCGQGRVGSFVKLYSKDCAVCPHCQKVFKLIGLTKIKHQR